MLEQGHWDLYSGVTVLVPAISHENLLRFLNDVLLKLMGCLILIMSEIKRCLVTNASFKVVKTKSLIGHKWPKMHILGLKN